MQILSPPSRVSPGSCAILALALLTCASPATTVIVDSYSYLTSPSPSYPDSGGELTNGTTYSAAWSNPPTTITLADVAGLTGWLTTNPGIRFNFELPTTVNSVTVWAADSDGSAGVGLPSSIVVRTPDNSFMQAFPITNPAGNGSTVPLVLGGFSVSTTSLIVEAQRTESWTMFSEVQFSSVPEPSSYSIAALLLTGALLRRRRTVATH